MTNREKLEKIIQRAYEYWYHEKAKKPFYETLASSIIKAGYVKLPSKSVTRRIQAQADIVRER